MKTYKTLTLVNHDLVDYPAESKIELEDAQAEPLLNVKAIVIFGEAKSASPKVEAPEGAARLAAINLAIKGLNVDVAENWSKSGAPKTEAIASVTGWPVSAAERDAVWVQINTPVEATE